MAQQTAVEYLIDNIHLLHSTKWNEIVINAKAMEKDQILMSRLNGFKISAEGWNAEWPFEGNDDSIISKDIENEQYYIQTYQQ